MPFHVSSMVRAAVLMRQAIGADGILLLTTTDAARITRELSAA